MRRTPTRKVRVEFTHPAKASHERDQCFGIVPGQCWRHPGTCEELVSEALHQFTDMLIATKGDLTRQGRANET